MNVQCPSCDTIYRIDPDKIPEGGVRARCTVCAFAIELQVPSPDEIPATAPIIHEPQQPEADVVAHIGPSDEPAPGPATEEPADEPVMIEPEPAAEAPEEVPPVRLSEPFAAPSEAPTEEPQPVTRPTAPVFKPTPDAPVQHAPVPPAPPAAPPIATPPAAEAAPPAPPVEEEVSPAASAPAVEETPPAAEPVPAEEAVPTVVQPAIETPPPAPEPTPVAEAPAAPAKPINPFLQRDPKQKARRLARALISDMIVYQPQKRQETLENGTLKEAFEEEIKKSWEEYVDQVGEEMANNTTFFKDALNEILAGGQEVF